MNNSNIPKVSIIIACYNHADFLEKVLLSLVNQSFKDFEIVIADDGSGPELAKVIERYSASFIHPIQHIWHEDLGFRKTIIENNAVRHSKADYIVFIDGDCILHHKFIERHFVRRKKNIVLSGRRIMLSEELSSQISELQITDKLFEKPSFWWNHTEPSKRKRGFYMPFIYHLLNFIGKDSWAFGSNFSMYKDDFVALNGYDETIIGRGLEDINLSQRIKMKGFKTNRVTYEALQYHLFHHSKEIPHSKEYETIILNPVSFYAEHGIH